MPQCPTCGSTVSDQAEVCPDCGMDLKEASASPSPAPEAPTPSGSPDLGPTPTPIPESSLTPTPSLTPSPELESSPEPSPSPVPPTLPSTPTPSSTGGGSRIILKRGGTLTSETFALGERVVVGRFDPESGPVDVDLGPLPEAAYISRHHSEIWRDETGQWLLKDLGSRNGSFVRSKGQTQFLRITGDQPIQDGDEIALGNARFEFHVD